MSLRQKVDEDLKAAMKAGAKDRLEAIRMLKSAAKYREIELGVPLDDAGLATVVNSLIKQRRDSAEQFKTGGRAEMAQKEEAEIVVLQEYLPAQLSADEIRKMVEDAILETKAQGPKDMGTVMKVLKEKIAGRADGKTLSDAVRTRLSSGA